MGLACTRYRRASRTVKSLYIGAPKSTAPFVALMRSGGGNDVHRCSVNLVVIPEFQKIIGLLIIKTYIKILINNLGCHSLIKMLVKLIKLNIFIQSRHKYITHKMDIFNCMGGSPGDVSEEPVT